MTVLAMIVEMMNVLNALDCYILEKVFGGG